MEEAIENLGVEKRKLIIEEQELSELKSELADYQEDIEDFRKVRIFYFGFVSCYTEIINSSL